MSDNTIIKKNTELSRRELNKLEKLGRIRTAAKEFFQKKGFEDTTMREIAASADVAFGTLFLYAKNKRDLLLLLFDEELPEVSDRAYSKAQEGSEIVDKLIIFFSEFYDFFKPTPSLSRDMLRENTFSSGGIVSQRIWDSVQDTEKHIARLVASAQAEGQINSGFVPDLAAHVIFSLYRVEVRFCMDYDEPDVEKSLANLRQQLELLLVGLSAGSAPNTNVSLSSN